MHSRLRKVRTMRRLRRRLSLRSLIRSESGTQLAELAIVLPILVVLFAGTVEFGRYFYTYSTLSKAARIGSRYLVTADVSAAEANNAKKLVVFGNTAGTGSPLIEGLTVDQVVVTPRNAAGQAMAAGVPNTITVEIVGFKHKPMVDLGGLIKSETFSLDIDVKPSVTMRYLLTTPLI